MAGDFQVDPVWERLPEALTLQIFSYLQPPSLCKVTLVCKSWRRIAKDELLWKDLFCRHYGIKPSVSLAPGKSAWSEEYKRLFYRTPSVESEVIKSHVDEVLHVSFSNNGTMFATCSKDGYLKVWDTCYPVSLKYMTSMLQFHFLYTQFSQFSPTDTLLFVSGPDSEGSGTSGMISVFKLEAEFTMVFRIQNDPFAIFGHWFDDQFLLLGNEHRTGYLKSRTDFELYKANQPAEPDPDSPTVLFTVFNYNGSSVRNIIVTGCRQQERDTYSVSASYPSADAKPKLARPDMPTTGSSLHGRDSGDPGTLSSTCSTPSNGGCIPHSQEGSKSSDTTNSHWPSERLFIFTKGSKTNVPHQIGIKKFDTSRITKDYEDSTAFAEEHASVEDKIDYVFDMDGHITGMKLSPDQRYLYVNNRPWPKNYHIKRPFDLPKIAEEVDIHVIDLLEMRDRGVLHRGHKAYTAEDSCFFLFPDVTHDYVASGAEDSHGYLWDRHYGVRLQNFPHNDVVNAVAFNPKDPEVLVSVSDDFSIKIWRSLNRQNEIKSMQSYVVDTTKSSE